MLGQQVEERGEEFVASLTPDRVGDVELKAPTIVALCAFAALGEFEVQTIKGGMEPVRSLRSVDYSIRSMAMWTLRFLVFDVSS